MGQEAEHDLGKLVQALLLFLDQEPGVAGDVEEEDVPDLDVKIVVGFRRNSSSLHGRKTGRDLFSQPQAASKSRRCREQRTWMISSSIFFFNFAGRRRNYFGANDATILSNRGSPRNGSQNGSNFKPP